MNNRQILKPPRKVIFRFQFLTFHFLKGESHFKKLIFLSSPMASKHSAFPVNEGLAHDPKCLQLQRTFYPFQCLHYYHFRDLELAWLETNTV